MPESASRTARLCEHIDETEDALDRLGTTVACALVELNAPPVVRRVVLSAFQDCRTRLRLVSVDGQHVNAWASIFKTSLHSMEVTPYLSRRIREFEADLERIDRITSIDDDAVELFPELAA